MKRLIIAFALVCFWLSNAPASACPGCRPTVEAGVYNGQFVANLGVLLLPLALLCAVGVAIYHGETLLTKVRGHKGERR